MKVFKITRQEINPYHHWTCPNCGGTMFTFYVKANKEIRTKKAAVEMLKTYLYKNDEYKGDYKHMCVYCFCEDLVKGLEV